MIDDETNKTKISKPIIIPGEINKEGVKRLIKQPDKTVTHLEQNEQKMDIDELLDFEDDEEITENTVITEPVTEQKRGRGRPKKIVPEGEKKEDKPKRGRGRPKKNITPQEL